MIYVQEFIEFCKANPCKMTSLRKQVLFILWSTKKPLKAYELLEKLMHIKLNAKPPTVYRVLDYFVEIGLVHKIESIQSYTICREPEKNYPSEVLMVCNHCYCVIEVYNQQLHSLLEQLSDENHFNLSQDVIELKGLCFGCSV